LVLYPFTFNQSPNYHSLLYIEEVTMLTESDLRELLEYKAHGSVLSIYLNTGPTLGSADAHKLRLRSMLKDVDLLEDVSVVERFFDHEFDWSGRSVAIFSCEADEFFRAYTLAVPVRSRVRVSDRPYVKPLADLLDSYGGYGVALVDKQGARLFYFHLGELREQEGVMGETVRHTKRGGGSQAAGRRGGSAGQTNYAEEVADRNAKESAEFAARFFTENNVRRILIGGTDDNIAPFRAQLPKAWQSLVVGTFPMSMTSSHAEVLERAMQVGRDAEHHREVKLIDAVVTGAAKGRGGVVRLEDTLGAVHEGRVQTLLIRDGYRAPGKRCIGCGYVTAQSMEKCQFCGAEFEQIPDAVELAVREVMQSGGDVEVLHDDHGLEEFEHIGALLRY
jgi:peptide chain release factor subunit 1